MENKDIDLFYSGNYKFARRRLFLFFFLLAERSHETFIVAMKNPLG